MVVNYGFCTGNKSGDWGVSNSDFYKKKIKIISYAHLSYATVLKRAKCKTVEE